MSSTLRAYYGSDTSRRREFDFYPTHPRLTRVLLAEVEFQGKILEPAAGLGDMVRELEAWGYEVDWFDKYLGPRRADFLEYSEPAENLVTNPPYLRGLIDEFVARALTITQRRVALLMRTSFMGTNLRNRWFEDDPPELIIHLGRWDFRDPEHQKPGGMVPYCWYVWNNETDPPEYTKAIWRLP